MPTDYYPLQDLLYRTTALTDGTGDIVEAYDTDAYGNTLIFNAPGTGGDWWADDATQTLAPNNAYIFTGRRYDPETEIYHYRARYYDPKQGRFISKDSIDYLDGFNLYCYVKSAPIKRRDPFGLESERPTKLLIIGYDPCAEGGCRVVINCYVFACKKWLRYAKRVKGDCEGHIPSCPAPPPPPPPDCCVYLHGNDHSVKQCRKCCFALIEERGGVKTEADQQFLEACLKKCG